jgi:hypothetical protein
MRKELRSLDMKNNPTVEEWFEILPLNVRNITHELIEVARKQMPEAHEYIYHDAVGYSANESPADRICYIAPQKKGYVNFGFFFGAGLPDPQNLLTGEGRRLRHVKVWSVEEANNPALATLIAQTWKEAPESIAGIHAGRKKSKG